MSLGQTVGATHACSVSPGSLKVCVGSLLTEVLGTAKAPHPSSLWVINVNKGLHNSSTQLPSPLPSLFFLSTLPPFTLTLFLPPSLLCVLTDKPDTVEIYLYFKLHLLWIRCLSFFILICSPPVRVQHKPHLYSGVQSAVFHRANQLTFPLSFSVVFKVLSDIGELCPSLTCIMCKTVCTHHLMPFSLIMKLIMNTAGPDLDRCWKEITNYRVERKNKTTLITESELEPSLLVFVSMYSDLFWHFCRKND